MTSVGVVDAGVGCRAEAVRGTRTRPHSFIKRDDGRLRQRYIEPAYPHTPAEATPKSFRRERLVASALRNGIDFVMASMICGPGDPTGRPGAAARLPSGRQAKGSR